MKRILYFAALSLLAACGKHGLEEFAAPDYTFYAYTPDAQADARTYVDEALKLRWTHDDRITVFHGMLQPLQFAFMGETGSLSGTYRNVDGVFYTPDPDAPNNVAVYPYSAAHTLNADDRSVMVMMPTEQTYVADSFGLNANTMIAITSGVEDMALYFKNVGTILNVRLWGTNQTVKSITLTATGGEALSGAAKVTPIYQGEPSCAMQDTEVQPSVKLICPEAVEVNTTEDAPVSFWLVLPPVTMRQGFTATVEDAEGATQTFAITQSVTFARNKYNTLTRELAIEQETPAVQASNEIWYTTTDNQPIDLSGISGTNAFATTIAAHAYSGGKGVITFDGDVTKVAGNAFSNKSTLVSVSLPDKVTEVGTKAFYYCTALTSVNIPDGVTKIGQNAFAYCSSLTSIEIPDGVQSIGGYAFSSAGLTSVVIPNSVTALNSSSFYLCKSLAEVTLGSGVKTIESHSFYGCEALTSIAIPAGVTKIEKFVFMNCTSLASVTLPDGITSIGNSAFENCALLSSITIPAMVQTFGTSSFAKCTSLTAIEVPSGVTSLPNNLFKQCSQLASVSLPEGLQTIGYNVFSECTSLPSIEIPATVTSIGSTVFLSCSSLAAVYCKATTVPTLDSRAFDNNASGRKIYVPATDDDSVVTAYKEAANWSGYADAIEEYDFSTAQ